MKTNVNLLIEFNFEAQKANLSPAVVMNSNVLPSASKTAASTNSKTGTKPNKGVLEMSTLERNIARLLPLPAKNGVPVVCCLDFGINYSERKEKYPDGFFCYYCNQFVEDFMLASPKRQAKMVPNAGRYKCAAGHTSFDTPTPLRVHHSLVQSSTSSDSIEDDDASGEF